MRPAGRSLVEKLGVEGRAPLLRRIGFVVCLPCLERCAVDAEADFGRRVTARRPLAPLVLVLLSLKSNGCLSDGCEPTLTAAPTASSASLVNGSPSRRRRACSRSRSACSRRALRWRRASDVWLASRARRRASMRFAFLAAASRRCCDRTDRSICCRTVVSGVQVATMAALRRTLSCGVRCFMARTFFDQAPWPFNVSSHSAAGMDFRKASTRNCSCDLDFLVCGGHTPHAPGEVSLPTGLGAHTLPPTYRLAKQLSGLRLPLLGT